MTDAAAGAGPDEAEGCQPHGAGGHRSPQETEAGCTWPADHRRRGMCVPRARESPLHSLGGTAGLLLLLLSGSCVIWQGMSAPGVQLILPQLKQHLLLVVFSSVNFQQIINEYF